VLVATNDALTFSCFRRLASSVPDAVTAYTLAVKQTRRHFKCLLSERVRRAICNAFLFHSLGHVLRVLAAAHAPYYSSLFLTIADSGTGKEFGQGTAYHIFTQQLAPRALGASPSLTSTSDQACLSHFPPLLHTCLLMPSTPLACSRTTISMYLSTRYPPHNTAHLQRHKGAVA